MSEPVAFSFYLGPPVDGRGRPWLKEPESTGYHTAHVARLRSLFSTFETETMNYIFGFPCRLASPFGDSGACHSGPYSERVSIDDGWPKPLERFT